MALIEALIAFIISVTGAASITVDPDTPHTETVETLEMLHYAGSQTDFRGWDFTVGPGLAPYHLADGTFAGFYCGLVDPNVDDVDLRVDPLCGHRAVVLHEAGHVEDVNDNGVADASIEPSTDSVEQAAIIWAMRRAPDAETFWYLYDELKRVRFLESL